MVQNSPYLTLCCKSSQKIFTYLYLGFNSMLPKHHLIHVAVVHTVFILPWSPVYSCRCAQMYNYAKSILLLLFHHISPSTSMAETVYKLHASIFFTCNHVRHLNTPPYYNTTQPQPLITTVCKLQRTQVTATAIHFKGVTRYILLQIN